MLGITPLPTVISKGQTGPTRASYEWNGQQSAGSASNRWARRGGSAWISVIGCQALVGSDITLATIAIDLFGTPLAADSITLTLQKNGTDTGLTVTLAAGATTATASGSVAVVKGDYLTMRATQSGTELETSFWYVIVVSD